MPTSSRLATRAALASLVSSIGLVGPAAFAQQTTAAAVPLTGFIDRSSSEVRIGGARSIVGAIVDRDGLLVDNPAIAWPRGAAAPDLCIESTSIDGSYWSKGELGGKQVDDNQGVVRFRYGSTDYRGEPTYRSAADKYGNQGLAVLATVGACGSDGKRNRFVVVDRAKSAAGPPSPVLLFVNTQRNDAELVYTPKGGAATSVRCQPPERLAYQRIAYDVVCRLPGPFDAETVVSLKLTRAGEDKGSYAFSLVMAAPTPRP